MAFQLKRFSGDFRDDDEGGQCVNTAMKSLSAIVVIFAWLINMILSKHRKISLGKKWNEPKIEWNLLAHLKKSLHCFSLTNIIPPQMAVFVVCGPDSKGILTGALQAASSIYSLPTPTPTPAPEWVQ